MRQTDVQTHRLDPRVYPGLINVFRTWIIQIKLIEDEYLLDATFIESVTMVLGIQIMINVVALFFNV